MAGRARIAGKGPVSASTGAHAASATPSAATAHTHAGALSSGAARSTLPALPDAGASGGALTTTATVGAAPGSLDGNWISPSPQRGPLAKIWMSFAIFMQLTEITLKMPEASTRASCAAIASNLFLALFNGSLVRDTAISVKTSAIEIFL